MKRYYRVNLSDGGAAFVGLMWLAIFFGSLYGYIANIVKLVGMLTTDSVAITGMLIARAAGTVIGPLGIILGYL